MCGVVSFAVYLTISDAIHQSLLADELGNRKVEKYAFWCCLTASPVFVGRGASEKHKVDNPKKTPAASSQGLAGEVKHVTT